tara:strand:+ start:713 stop:1627 length:915 start_codon:yes stop_codon:yes gene_type:complete
MSGSSAVASARRRRAESTPQPITSQNNKIAAREQSKVEEESVQKQVSTPLQILQIHDKKIKEFEENLEKTIVEISKTVVAENLKYYKLDQPAPVVKEFDSKPLLEKINNLSSQFDELKTLVIKKYQTVNESSLEMLKIKDTVLTLEQDVSELKNELKEVSQNEENLFNMGGDNSAEMLLRTMMQSSMMQSSMMGNTTKSNSEENNKINIHDNESDDESDNIGEISELTLTESDLSSINSEIKPILLEDDIMPDKIVENDESSLLEKNKHVKDEVIQQLAGEIIEEVTHKAQETEETNEEVEREE